MFDSGLDQVLKRREGPLSATESVLKTLHMMDGMEQPFTLVVLRRLPMLCEASDGLIDCDRYVYRAIAAELPEFDASDIVHWYNRRGECSENRIKEFRDDFTANALYSALCMPSVIADTTADQLQHVRTQIRITTHIVKRVSLTIKFNRHHYCSGCQPIQRSRCGDLNEPVCHLERHTYLPACSTM